MRGGKYINEFAARLGKAGASGPVALAYEQIVGSNARNAKASLTVGSTTTRLETRRLSMLGGQPTAYLRLAYSNYYVDSNGAEQTIGNSYTLEAAIEVPTAPVTSCVRVTFSGSNTGTVADGEGLFLSDPIPASAFGLTAIPAGTTIYIHDSVLVANAQKIPVPASYTNSPGEASVQNNNASSQVMTAGVPTGTEVNLQSPLIGVLGAFTAPEVSAVVVGDSIADFGVDTNGSGLNGNNGGLYVRALWNVNGRNVPWVNIARSSSQVILSAQTFARRFKIMVYGTHLISEGGTNDLASAATAANTQTALQNIWQTAHYLGISHIAQANILPRTASTDAWATVANQTPVAGFTNGGQRDILNTALVANVGSNFLDEVLDVSSVLADSGTPTAWKAPNYTVDGVHPAATALTVGAAYLNGRFALWTPAAAATAAAVSSEAQAVASAFTNAPTAARLKSIDRTIKIAKGFGLWQLRDFFGVFAAADSQAAAINWKSPGTFNITVVGTPTFVADRGFTGDGVSGGLNSGYVPSVQTGGNYKQNTAQVDLWSLGVGVAANNSNRIVGNAGASTSRTLFNPRAVGNGINWIMNDATFGAGGTNALTDGFWALRRTGATSRDVSRELATIASDAQASTGVPTAEIAFLHDGATFSSGIPLATGSFGAAFSSYQNACYRNNVLYPYLKDVGAQ